MTDEDELERYRRSLKRSTFIGEAIMATGVVLMMGVLYIAMLVVDACRHATWP